jgi:hypothetical protein
MPRSDASQFTQFKRANAVQGGNTPVSRLTQFTPRLTASHSIYEFLPSLSSKYTTPITRDPINFGSRYTGLRNQNCS